MTRFTVGTVQSYEDKSQEPEKSQLKYSVSTRYTRH